MKIKKSLPPQEQVTCSSLHTIPSRRRILKGSILAGASLPFLPESWSSPAVSSAILPAHAQTTTGSSAPSCDNIEFELTSSETIIDPPEEITITLRVTNNSDQPFDMSDEDAINFSMTSDLNGFFPDDIATFARGVGIVPPGETRQNAHTNTLDPLNQCDASVGGTEWRLVPRIPADEERCDEVLLIITCSTPG